MSGTGGIYPSYEDNLLDKKKISEHFAGNFHEIIYPLNYTSKYGPWQYHCPADVRNFTDLNSLTWNGRIKVVNKVSPNTPVINNDQAKDVNCSVVNNFIHSCISKITYKINDFQMGDSSSKSYSYRAYLDNLLSFSSEAKQQNLKYHGFIKDKASDSVAKTRLDHANDGFIQRADIFCTGNYFHFSVKLRIDLANIDQYLQPGVQMRFDIERNSDSFTLLSDVGDETSFEFDIKDTTIEFDKLVPTLEYQKHFESQVGKNKLIYNYDRCQIQTYNFSSGINDLSISSLFHSDKLPSYLVFGMVSDDAFNGTVAKNPFRFQPFDLKETYLLVNGVSVPTQPIKMDVSTKDYHHVFVNEFLDKLKLKNSNESIGVSAEDWIDSNFLWIADLNVDKCSNFHEHRSHPGTIHLKMQTKTSIPENVRLIVYSSSRERFSINPKTGDVHSTVSM
jgi:hypothetical protein